MATVTVSQVKSNVDVNSTTSTVSVTQAVSNVSISATGVTTADIRSALSNTSPITYNSLTGVIGLEQTLDDLTLKKYQETIVDNGSGSGNVSVNINNGTVHTFNLTGNITGITLNNIADGGSATLFFLQDSLGGISLDTTTHASNFTNWNFTNDFKTFDTTGSAYNIINVFYDAPKYYATLITKTLPAIQNSELANSSLTVNGTSISLGSSGNIANFGTLTTTNLTEGSNQYFTTARANSAITDYIGSSENAPFAFAGNLNVTGNITASGNVNYENVVDLNVQDQEITLNSNAATDATVSIIANRPTGNNAVLRWNETSDKWEFNNTGSYFPIPTSTSDLTEGTNLYFTNARANTVIGTNTTDNLTEGSSNLYFTDTRARGAISVTSPLTYNSGTGVLGITEVGDISEVVAGNGLTGGGSSGSVTLNAVGGYGITVNADNIEVTNSQIQAQANVAIGNNTTTNLAEGTNLYYTDARVNTYINANNSANFNQLRAFDLIIKDGPAGNDVYKFGANSASNNQFLVYDGTQFKPTTPTTSIVNEGTNQYFTTARANSAISSYQGNIATAGTVTATKFDTTSNVFDLANAVTNLNSITSESANDKFTFKALLGGAATETDTGNITSDGYEVILDSSHTYDSTGNIAQKSSGSNNLNGFAVSGAFVKDSSVFTITGVTHLKNVATGGNIDGTNNNVSLTGDMVANMIPDNFKTLDGDQYPLPPGSLLAGANATALVFTNQAVANQTFANTSPIAIVHGGKDNATGQIVGFLSEDDAVADGTQVVNIDTAGNFGLIPLSFAGESPSTGETSDSILVGLPSKPSIPVGTAVTFAGVTGTGASNLNGQTLFARRSVFGPADNGNYTFTTDVGGTTAATMTAFGLSAGASGSGNITYTASQSSSTINKARFYKKDVYGYPKVGPKAEDFTYTRGSASNYTIDLSAATKQTRGRTSLEAPKQVLKAPIGLTIGENTTMSNRGDGDSLTNFGLNFMWDGLTDYSTVYQGTTSNIVPQMLFKNHTDNTFGAGASGKGRGGPRLFFSAATGNINTADSEKYPRKSQEIGRMMFWGSTQSAGSSGMSTVNPAGYISATASEDWTTNNTLEMSLAANGNGVNDADIFLNYRNGQVVLASGTNGSAHQPIHFAPALQGVSGNAAQTYASVGHTWANVNYANVAGTSGSKFTVTQGSATSSSSGDLVIAIDREEILGSTTLNLQAVGNGAVLDQDAILGNGNENTIVVVTSASADIVDANPVTFTSVGGPGAANLNGQSFFIKAGSAFDSGGSNPDSFQLFHDAGLSNAVVRSQIGYDTNPATFLTGGGTTTITTTGTAAKDYSLSLDTGSDQLKIKSGTTAKITIDDNFTQFNDRIRLKNHTTAEINALASPAAGDVVFCTDASGGATIVFYNGSSWQKVSHANL